MGMVPITFTDGEKVTDKLTQTMRGVVVTAGSSTLVDGVKVRWQHGDGSAQVVPLTTIMKVK